MTLAVEALACRRGERLVFEGLAFELRAGGALLLTGPNGSGKSTLLRCLATLLPAEAGRVRWAGADIAEDLDAHRRRLAYIGHLNAVKPLLTVRENLAFWARLAAVDDGAIEAALAALRIAQLAEVPAARLSAGQRKRVALARPLLGDAALWLLDEPSVSLDADGTDRLAGLIEAHRTEGGIAIIATHLPLDLTAAETLRLGDG